MKRLRYTLIRDQEQYDQYCNILESKVSEDAKKFADEVDLLSLLVSEYNDRIMEGYHFEMNPVELLQNLIEENNLSQNQLAKKVGVSPQLVNDVLKYRREITKKLAYSLSAEFMLKYSAFLKPYKLKKAS